MMDLKEYKIEHLINFEELSEFYTGKEEMDVFLHNHFTSLVVILQCASQESGMFADNHNSIFT